QSISDARDSDIQHVYVKSNGDMFYYTSSVLTVICPLDEELHLVSTVKPMFDNSTAVRLLCFEVVILTDKGAL
ncbi:hypothetical protein GCK32_020891, partial [Trichostrongylus colubriformis]